MMKKRLHKSHSSNSFIDYWYMYGKYAVGLLVVVILCVIARQIYVTHRNHSEYQASVIYYQFVNSNSVANNQVFINTLQNRYQSTEYAALASVRYASDLLQNGDTKGAIANLVWVEKYSCDSGLKNIAKLDLAGVYIQMHDFTDSTKVLLSKHDKYFDALFYAKRGDMYVAMGNIIKARDAYSAALHILGPDNASSIRFKLALLGS